MTNQKTNTLLQPSLLVDLRSFIETAREQVAQAANSALTLLYWQVGERIRREVLHDERAAYGQEILLTLSAKLVPEYGVAYKKCKGDSKKFANARASRQP